jgi:VCBS repeat-containing protein
MPTMNPGVHELGIDDVDRFQVVVTDAYGEATTEDLVITLKPLSHSPVCEDAFKTWDDSYTFVSGNLIFSDLDLGVDPNESLLLAVNEIPVTTGANGTLIQGLYGQLVVYKEGYYSYTTQQHLGEPLLEHFTYTVTDTAGNSSEAHIYIRLSEDAPPYPNSGIMEEAASSEESIPDISALGASLGEESDEAGSAAFASQNTDDDSEPLGGLKSNDAPEAGIIGMSALAAPLGEENGEAEGLVFSTLSDNGFGNTDLLNFSELDEPAFSLSFDQNAGFVQESGETVGMALSSPIGGLLDFTHEGVETLDTLLIADTPENAPVPDMGAGELIAPPPPDAVTEAPADMTADISAASCPAPDAFEQQAVLESLLKSHFG